MEILPVLLHVLRARLCIKGNIFLFPLWNQTNSIEAYAELIPREDTKRYKKIGEVSLEKETLPKLPRLSDTLITPTMSKHLLLNDKFRYHSMDLGWVTLW